MLSVSVCTCLCSIKANPALTYVYLIVWSEHSGIIIIIIIINNNNTNIIIVDRLSQSR